MVCDQVISYFSPSWSLGETSKQESDAGIGEEPILLIKTKFPFGSSQK